MKNKMLLILTLEALVTLKEENAELSKYFLNELLKLAKEGKKKEYKKAILELMDEFGEELKKRETLSEITEFLDKIIEDLENQK